jgi:hypothetical protein
MPPTRKSLLTAAVLIAGAALACQPSEAAVRRVLLSVHGLGVPLDKSIYAYRIDTWGVEFLAVCAVPQSWELKSEKFEDSEGYLSGQADIHGTPLQSLTNMYLVDVYDYRPTTAHVGDTEHPASFKGWVRIGSREQFGDWHGRKVTLRAKNFRLKDATRCPAPPPASP